jgi:hypothetical protein
VRERPRFDLEWTDRERLAGLEHAQVARSVEHAGPVEREHGAQGTGQRMDRQGRSRIVAKRASAQERIHVGDMVGMPVADQHGVECLGRQELEQSRQDGVARIDEQPEAAVFD